MTVTRYVYFHPETDKIDWDKMSKDDELVEAAVEAYERAVRQLAVFGSHMSDDELLFWSNRRDRLSVLLMRLGMCHACFIKPAFYDDECVDCRH